MNHKTEEEKSVENTVACPLCEQGRMYLTELESAASYNENKSYIWICTECPGILLEWWGTDDTNSFVDYIEESKGVIKQWLPPEYETNEGAKSLLKKEEM